MDEIARSSKWCPVQRLGATTEEPKAMDWVFSFPRDGQLRKAWIHYCRRWNFDPTSGHRLFSTHFTRDCFENDGTWCWWNLQATTEARCNPMIFISCLLSHFDRSWSFIMEAILWRMWHHVITWPLSSLKCIGQRSGRFQKIIINKMGVLGGYFQIRQCL